MAGSETDGRTSCAGKPADGAVFIRLAADGGFVVGLQQIRHVQMQVGADEFSTLDVRRDVQDFE